MLVAGGIAGFLFYDRLTAVSATSPAGGPEARAVTVEVATVEVQRVHDRAEAVGTTLSRQAIEIVPLSSGRIAEILFEPGAMVERGEILVRLDDDIERADLAEAEALLREAELALDRARRLRASNNIAAATVVELEARAAAAKARVDRAAQHLDDRLVRAPFAGILGIRQVDVGARIDNDTRITTLDDRSELQLEFSLPERIYGRIAAGQTIEATSSGFPGRRFGGIVTTVDSRIDVAARAFRVRAALPNPDLVLPAGLFMLVEVTLEERDALVVPEEAVVLEAGRSFVFVVAGDRAERRPVVLGTRGVGTVEVRQGLEPGETVVTRGIQRLRDGMPVRIAEPAVATLG